MKFENNEAFALQLDKADVLAAYREHFYIPKINGQDCIYMCGNSLGLQPKIAKAFVDSELTDWAELGVEGHVHGKKPWLYYHHFTQEILAKIVGAQKEEVVAMGSLTNNLHLLLISFYRPTTQRYKILIEHRPFPSDQYAVASQAKLHGYTEAEAIIEMKPRLGEVNLRTEDILATIKEHGNELAVVMLGGVHFYTGECLDMAAITEAAHAVGAYCGFDLAHAVGNVPMELHDWKVDFACWCTYKYLNSGPGGVGGLFVHALHHKNEELNRLEGWWGHDEANRFKMENKFVSMGTAESWQMSNAPVMAMAIHQASLEIIDLAGGMKPLRQKSELLTNYFEFLLLDAKQKNAASFHLLTPSDPKQRGCQLSISFTENGKQIHERLTAKGVIADWREPGVIRMAPVPLYNSFSDVFHLVNRMF